MRSCRIVINRPAADCRIDCLTAAVMKLILLLLCLTTPNIKVIAQLGSCSEKILQELNEEFFDALRKEESDGDICKTTTVSTAKLGPYQINEAYYNEAVEDNQELKTGGTDSSVSHIS